MGKLQGVQSLEHRELSTYMHWERCVIAGLSGLEWVTMEYVGDSPAKIPLYVVLSWLLSCCVEEGGEGGEIYHFEAAMEKAVVSAKGTQRDALRVGKACCDIMFSIHCFLELSVDTCSNCMLCTKLPVTLR